MARNYASADKPRPRDVSESVSETTLTTSDKSMLRAAYDHLDKALALVSDVANTSGYGDGSRISRCISSIESAMKSIHVELLASKETK